MLISIFFFLSLFFITYKLLLVPYIETGKLTFHNFLNTRFFVFNNTKYSLHIIFFNIKKILLIICLAVFTYATKKLIFQIFMVTGYKLVIATFIYGLPYFWFALETYKICYKAFKHKQIFVIDILKIFLFSLLLISFSIYLHELFFNIELNNYKGYKDWVDEPMETIKVHVSK